MNHLHFDSKFEFTCLHAPDCTLIGAHTLDRKIRAKFQDLDNAQLEQLSIDEKRLNFHFRNGREPIQQKTFAATAFTAATTATIATAKAYSPVLGFAITATNSTAAYFVTAWLLGWTDETPEKALAEIQQNRINRNRECQRQLRIYSSELNRENQEIFSQVSWADWIAHKFCLHSNECRCTTIKKVKALESQLSQFEQVFKRNNK